MKHKILLGITGTVASTLVNKIKQAYIDAGMEVTLVASKYGQYFMNHVGNVYNDNDEWIGDYYLKTDPIPHIDLRESHSAFVLICSANTLAKVANGICDNLITSIARAWSPYKPFILCPAMNTTMWDHPITAEHLDDFTAFSRNNFIVNPQEKMLACGTFGMGALAPIQQIVDSTMRKLNWCFPLDACYGIPVGNHPGAFAFVRKGSKHTGLDLYTDLHAKVWAVEDGEVVGVEKFTGEWDNSPWWNNTQCVLVKGASGVVNYGEINPDPVLIKGSKIKRGQFIGSVLRVIKEGRDHYEIPGWRPTMLHIELYNHDVLKASEGFQEKILHDPTPFLLATNNTNFPIVRYEGTL